MLAQLQPSYAPSVLQIVHHRASLLPGRHLTLRGAAPHLMLEAGGQSAAQLHALVACPSLQALQAWTSPSRSSQQAGKS